MFSPELVPPNLLRELESDERVLWSGQPSQVATLVSQLPLALFGTFWSTTTIIALYSAAAKGGAMASLFVAPFVVVGLAMMLWPLIEAYKARQTLFAITDRRLLMIFGGGRKVTSVNRAAISQVERVQRSTGITLRIPTALVSDNDGGQKADYAELHGIPDGGRAYRLLTRA